MEKEFQRTAYNKKETGAEKKRNQHRPSGKQVKGKHKGKKVFKRATKLFIGGLPPTCTEQDLWNYLKNVNSLKKVEIKVGHDGVGKGFAFINLEDPEEASSLICQEHRMFGKLFSIKSLTNWKDRELAKQTENERKFYIGGLSRRLTEMDVEQYFRQYGKVEDIIINRRQSDGRSNGFGFITFESIDTVERLSKLSPRHYIQGSPLLISRCFGDRKTDKNKSKRKYSRANKNQDRLHSRPLRHRLEGDKREENAPGNQYNANVRHSFNNDSHSYLQRAQKYTPSGPVSKYGQVLQSSSDVLHNHYPQNLRFNKGNKQ